jgi:uncharacterized repeat protein (TIGR01451 family)
VTFGTDLGTFAGAPSIARTTSGGVALADLHSTSAGVANVTASAGSASAGVQVRFLPGAPARIALQATPVQAPADGAAEIVVQALVTDAYDNLVADGTTIAFTTTLGTLDDDSAPTAGGTANVGLRSGDAGQAVVRASHGTISSTATVAFQPVLILSKTVNQPSVPGGSVITYTILIRNATPGGEAAQLSALRDFLPAGFGFLPGSVSGSAFSGAPVAIGQELTWSASPLPYALAPGAEITTVFAVTATAPAGTYANTASLEGTNFVPVHTGPAAPVTLLAPILGPMLPVSGCNDTPVVVLINGTNFVPGALARLGEWDLSATWLTPYRLEGTVPAYLPAGPYDLTVANPGGATATLADAYTVLDCAPDGSRGRSDAP